MKLALQRAKLIYRCFYSKSMGFLVKAYKSYVRPLLEYGTVVWNPLHIIMIDKLESVQRRFTRMNPGLKSLNYVY